MRTSMAVLGVLAACGGGSHGPGVPIEVAVVAPRKTVLGKDVSRPIEPADVETIRGRPEVTAVVPRLELRTAALGTMSLEGRELHFEVGGFTDGIPASAVADDPALAARFTELDPGAALGPTCAIDAACPDATVQYCDARDDRCRARVPVILSPTLIELYNDQFVGQHGLPRLGEVELRKAVDRRSLTFTISLGESNIVIDRDPPAAHHAVGALVIGVSPRARLIGMTVPIGHVAAWNRALQDGRSATAYSSLDVTLRDADRLAAFTAWVRELGYDVSPR